MKLKIKNEIIDYSIKEQSSGFEVALQDTRFNFQAQKLDNNTFALKNGQTRSIAFVAEDNDHYYLQIEGECFVFDKVSEETSFDNNNADSSSRLELKPPMPGSIVKINVELGQKVEEGDSLIIVEAMKMETSLYSSISGVVTEINVAVAEQVDSDKTLIVVEKEEE